MGKLLLISFNLLVIMISKLYFGGDVSVTEELPKHAKPGESFEVTIEIEKGDREGFAKWQQAIPNGFTATKGETEGGTFSFKNQEIKIIWMALPAAEKFAVTFSLQSEASLNGEFYFDGKFSYIEENERKEVIAEKKSILISENPPAMAAVIPTETEDTLPTDEVVGESESEAKEMMADAENMIKPTTTSTIDASSVTDQVLNNENIKIKRTITHINDGYYEVDLEIDKGDFESFGKIEEFVPPNYTASAIESKDGIFSFSKNVMKVMWMTLPKEDVVNVKYGLQSTSDDLDSATVFGVFSFLLVDQSKQLKLDGSKFKNYLVIDPIIAENTEDEGDLPPSDNNEMADKEMDTVSDDVVETIVEDIADNTAPPVENSSDVEPEAVEIPESSEEELIEDITNIPSPETAVSYRVQIAAAKREVQQQYFIDRHNVREEVTIQSHEGWYKYTIGSYNVYKAARDKRNKVWGADNKINDAFVTAYNEGVRISVQEALMVTKQKWYN